mgnify:FL=1
MSELNFEPADLASWIEQQTGRSDLSNVAPLRGGGSCEMFSLSLGDERFVIRRAPVATVSDTAHNVVREFKIIEALSTGNVRVPELLAACEDTSVLGAPFYIM